MVETFDLLVVGGGPAGLAHAFWRLRAAPALRILVVEASPRAGGWVHTEVRDGFTCERGPQGFRPTVEADAFVAALGLADAVVPAAATAARRWIVLDGRARELPGSPRALLTTRALGWSARLRLLREAWVAPGADPGESVAHFAERRFGGGTRHFAEALARGVFAGDADRLEMAAAFPAAVELERRHGSVLRGMRQQHRQRPAQRRPALCTFAGGMATSIRALARILGDRLRLSTPARAIARIDGGWQVQLGGKAERVQARELALAVPANRAAALLAPLDDELAQELRAIPFASVASTFVGAKAGAFTGDLAGFGCLQPKSEGPILGALYCASTFPAHAPPGMQLVRVMSGGAGRPEEVARPDAELGEQAIAFAARVLGLRGDPTFVHVERALAGIPQYERGHGERLARIAVRLRTWPHLSLLGASYRQVSVVGQWTEHGSRP